jgi:PHD/YefM family antitoxin component YafN of YafNO toxin-antitoxin module
MKATTENRSPTIETISYLKKNAANLNLDEPLVITQNGKPAYVIESYESKTMRDEAISLLKFVALAKQDVTKNRVKTVGSFRDGLVKRKQSLKRSNNEQKSTNSI